MSTGRCTSSNEVSKKTRSTVVDVRSNFHGSNRKCTKRQFPSGVEQKVDCRNLISLKGLSSPSLQRHRPKPSIINACYTPSSLFRSANLSSASKLSLKKTKQYSNSLSQKSYDGEDRMKVAVRIRPLNNKECLLSSVANIVQVNGNDITVLVGASTDASSGVSHTFRYDNVFCSCNPEAPSYASQNEVFLKTAQPLIAHAFEGYNACLFAYGQTGSGKSYSMMGIETFNKTNIESLGTSELNPNAGIIPRFCYELFQYISSQKDKLQVEIEVSYFEIYNEKIHDLLCVSEDLEITNISSTNHGTPIKHKKPLKVREHPIWGPYVVDLSVRPVDTFEALRNWLIVGNSQRAAAATGLNEKSSRSHSIFNIMLNMTHSQNSDLAANDNKNKPHQSLRSKISLVDLAGSERLNRSSGERIREGIHINKSLLTLGKVISALSDDRNGQNSYSFVPYRESVLTWLLRENLGGNSKTVMLATISPASIHVDETLATLRYACQARRIVNRVKVNESEHDKVIRELKSEVERLKSLHCEYERQKKLSGNTNVVIDTFNKNESEIRNLKEQLSEREKELIRAQKSWLERLQEAEDLRKSELHLLKRKGLAIALHNEQQHACLINLTEDPMLTETLFYLLPPGCVKIGRTRSALIGTKPDIILDGPLVAHNHCSIDNIRGELFVTSENSNFETYLNGELVNSKKKMFHGDRLVIGGSHFFRVSNPFCSQKDEKKKLADFYQAYQEVLETQEEKLRIELEEEKKVVLTRIENDRIEHERSVKERMDKIELEQLMLKCNKEILQSERKIIEQKTLKLIALEADIVPDHLVISSNQSNLLHKINNIMQQPSQRSLHKVQLMVKEATERCRSHHLLYEFKQSQVIDEFGIFHTKILIIDKIKRMKAEWPIARLEVWLDSMREHDSLNIDNIFNCFDVEWEYFGENSNESSKKLNNFGCINLNISALKCAVMVRDVSKPMQALKLTTNEINFENEVKAHVSEIKHSISKLKNICKSHENDEQFKYYKSSHVITESIERLEYTLKIMQSCFE